MRARAAASLGCVRNPTTGARHSDTGLSKSMPFARPYLCVIVCQVSRLRIVLRYSLKASIYVTATVPHAPYIPARGAHHICTTYVQPLAINQSSIPHHAWHPSKHE